MTLSQPDILHMTTVHKRTDTRIAVKELKAVESVSPGRTWLAVADGGADAMGEDGEDVIINVGRPPGGRIGRALIGSWRMYKLYRRFRPKIVHFHDPELLFLGCSMKLSGCRVVYDVHEDVPRQIREKYWLPVILRPPIAVLVTVVEWIAAKMFDAIIAATPTIANRFPFRKTVIIRNYPVLKEFSFVNNRPYEERKYAFAYVGTIARLRGALEMMHALDCFDDDEPVRLCMAGDFDEKALEEEAKVLPGWCRVQFEGWVNRETIVGLLGEVRAGLVLFHPTSNNRNGYPVKLFEYMSASLPVIASDFPLWRGIVEEAGCGLLVDPEDPEAIAGAMRWILDHPEEAEEMGRSGRRAVEEKYNWEAEAEKLRRLYERLLA